MGVSSRFPKAVGPSDNGGHGVAGDPRVKGDNAVAADLQELASFKDISLKPFLVAGLEMIYVVEMMLARHYSFRP